jgi:hypothetical protein
MGAPGAQKFGQQMGMWPFRRAPAGVRSTDLLKDLNANRSRRGRKKLKTFTIDVLPQRPGVVVARR